MTLSDTIPLNKRLSLALKTAADPIAYRSAGPAGDMVSLNQRSVDGDTALLREQERLRQQEAQKAAEAAEIAKWKDWFDASDITEERPLKPVQVWDPSVSMAKDTKYDDWWEKPTRKLFQRGPGTTSFDTTRYKPNGVGDYIIWFGGAGSGVDGWSADPKLPKQYGGEGNIAKFTWKQIPEALDFVYSLPKGSRLFINGHSMGGHAAIRFANELKKKGINIAGMDLRDPVRIDNRLNSYRQKFLSNIPLVNHFVKYPQLEAPTNVTRGVNYYNPGMIHNGIPFFSKGFNISDYVSLIGSRINNLRNNGNFTNIQAPYNEDHIDIGWKDLSKYFPYFKNVPPQPKPVPKPKQVATRKLNDA